MSTWDEDGADPDRLARYRSRMITKYLELLGVRKSPEVLDCGPISQRNISFFSGYVSKLHVYDVLREIESSMIPEHQITRLLHCMDYWEGGLDAIHLWDIPDHLEDMVLKRFVDRCCYLLKPGGLVITFTQSLAVNPLQYYLNFETDHYAILRRVPSIHRRLIYRKPTTYAAVMEPLRQFESFIYNGKIQEFVLALDTHQ